MSEFEFELAEEESDIKSIKSPFSDIPELISVGISDLSKPLMVKASKRRRANI